FASGLAVWVKRCRLRALPLRLGRDLGKRARAVFGRGHQGRGTMRLWPWLPALLTLAACSSGPSDHAKLTLRNMQWNHVNVQVVITRAGNCDDRGSDFISSQDLVLQKEQTKTIVAPNETTVCWRHDRYPTNPHPGEWSGWSRAILFPGNDSTTDL